MERLNNPKNTTDLYSTPEELANEILMMGNTPCLLVEGNTDYKFWSHIQSECCNPYNIMVATRGSCPGGNKECVIETMKKIETKNVNIHKAIIDIDFDYLQKKVIVLPNLYYYQYHDLEITLLLSSAFKTAYNIISKKPKDEKERNILKDIFQISKIVGLLRLSNHLLSLNIGFAKLNYKKILEKFEIGGEENLKKYLYQYLEIPFETKEKIEPQYQELKRQKLDLNYLCNGHDALNLLTQYLINKDNKHLDDNYLRYLLYLAYPKPRPKSNFNLDDMTDLLISSSNITQIISNKNINSIDKIININE